MLQDSTKRKIFEKARGFRDLMPEFCQKRDILFRAFSTIADTYNCQQIQTPTVEFTDLFVRGIGTGTDIVDKEMFTFDYDKESLCLTPEGTAGTVRAMVNQGVFSGRFFYLKSCFRKERPQKGRYREFFQLGAEFVGRKDVNQDIECLNIIIDFFDQFNVKYILKINNIGTAEDRQKYIKVLEEYLQSNFARLSDTSKDRLENKNILRILDSKEDDEIIQNAPKILDYLNIDSDENFKKTQQFLKNNKTPFVVDPCIVRGLDYYNDLVFEFISTDFEGSQNTICGGGRYDGLFETLGGQATSAIGFGIGLDRMIEIADITLRPQKKIAVVCDLSDPMNIKLITDLRKKELNIEIFSNEAKTINKIRKNFDKLVIIENESKIQFEDLNTNEKKEINNLSALMSILI